MVDIIIGLVVFALIYGVVGWIIHLFFILMSLRSETKGMLELYYNRYKELYPEIVLIAGLVIFEIIGLIIYVNIII